MRDYHDSDSETIEMLAVHTLDNRVRTYWCLSISQSTTSALMNKAVKSGLSVGEYLEGILDREATL